MKTLEEKRKELTKKHESEIRELLLSHTIENNIPALFRKSKYRIHIYNLWGSKASIKFGDNFRHDNIMDLSTINLMYNHFKPLPLCLFSNACLSFRTMEHINTLLPETVNNARIETVAPYIIKIDGFTAQHAAVKWYTKIGDIITEIECISDIGNFGRYDIRIKYMKGKTENDNRFIVNPNITKLTKNGKSIADLEKIRWTRGSSEYCNDYTLYYYYHDENNIPDLSILCDAITAEK